jgi:GWxTD domain-containing protein
MPGTKTCLARRSLAAAAIAAALAILGLGDCTRPPGPHGYWHGNKWDREPPPPISARDSLYYDMEMLLSQAERDSLQALPDHAAVTAWINHFWLMHDPTPASFINERLAEHSSRLAYVREHFPRMDPPYFDARGRDYVLFGAPDRIQRKDVDVMGVFYQPRREIWVWQELGQLAEYEDFFLDGNYQPAFDETFPLNPRNRMQEGSTLSAPFSNDWLVNEGPSLIYAFDKEELEPITLESRGNMDAMRSAHEVAVEEARVHSTDLFHAPPLWAVFAIDCFRGEGGLTRAELSYQLKIDDLEFQETEDSRWEARFRQSLVYLDSLGRKVSRQSNEIRLDRPGAEANEPDALFAGLMRRELPPGDYHLSLQLEDLQEGPLQIFDTPVQVPAFGADTLRLSDITFASSITRSPVPKLFRKGEWNVFPHPLHRFSAAYPIHIYFEIYGLETDRRGANDYRLSYRIRKAPREQSGVRGWLGRLMGGDENPVDISASLVNRQEGEFSAHPLIIGAGDLDGGNYLIEVSVEDLKNGSKASRWGSFNVAPAILPEDSP